MHRDVPSEMVQNRSRIIRTSRRGLFDDRPRVRAEIGWDGVVGVPAMWSFCGVTLCFPEGCGVEQDAGGNKQAERGRPMEQLESAIRPSREVPGCVEFGDVRQAQIWLVKKFQQQQVIPLSSWKSVAKTVSN